MSQSVRSTPSRDNVLSQRSQSPLTNVGNLFAPDSNYSDPAYISLTIPSTQVVSASPVDTSGIDMIRRIRSAMENWTSALGPVEDWPRVFREQYDEACVNTTAPTTQAAIDGFLGQVGEHVRIGKDIIAQLESCQCQRAEADWLLAGDLMRTLHCGVALLEARLEIHAPSGAHLSPLHSSICRHEEFVT